MVLALCIFNTRILSFISTFLFQFPIASVVHALVLYTHSAHSCMLHAHRLSSRSLDQTEPCTMAAPLRRAVLPANLLERSQMPSSPKSSIPSRAQTAFSGNGKQLRCRFVTFSERAISSSYNYNNYYPITERTSAVG